MSILKKSLFFVIVPVSLFLFTGCTDNNEKTPGKESTTSASEVAVDENGETILSEEKVEKLAQKLVDQDSDVDQKYVKAYSTAQELYENNASPAAIVIYMQEDVGFSTNETTVAMTALNKSGADFEQNARNVMEEVRAEAEAEGKTLTNDEVVQALVEDYYFNEDFVKTIMNSVDI